MPFPVALAAVGAGSSLLGGLLGGGNKTKNTLPPWLIDMLREQVGSARRTQFLPDREVFDQAIQAQIGQATSGLPTSLEAYRGQQASRGVFTSGQGAAAEYRDVYAPVAGQIGSAVAQGNLQYQNLYMQGQQAQQQGINQALAMLVQGMGMQSPDTGIGNTLGGFFSGAGGFASQLSMLKALGLV